jgi:hypothetical protein
LQTRSRTRAFHGAMDVTFTDGGIETRIIYEFKHQIGDFEAYKLLENGTDERYIGALAKAAVDHGESAA